MIKISLPDAIGDEVWTRLKSHTAAEINADIEPAGYQFIITIWQAAGTDAVLMLGSEAIELGKAVIEYD
jgi:hypothetical protein